MKAAETRYALLTRNIMSVLMVFAITYGLSTYFHLEIGPVFLAIAAVALDVLFAVFDHLKKKPALWLTLFGAIVIAVVALEITGVSVRVLLQTAREWVQDAFMWFALFTNGGVETVLEPAYVLFFACLGLLGSTLLCYPLTCHMVSRFILSAAALAAVVFLPIFKIPLGKFPLACVGVCVMSSVVELVNLQFDRHRVESKRNAGVFLYPVCVLLILIAVLLPSRDTPIRWQPVRDLLERISVNAEITLKTWFGVLPEKFTISFQGMSFTDEDAGINADEEAILMRVSTNGMTRSPAYLRGSVSSTYTGTGWKDDSETYFGEQEADIELYEVQYSLLRSGLTPERGEDLHKRSTLNIEFNDIITKSLMYSAPLSKIKTENEESYSLYGPNIRFRKMQKTGLTYSMSYYETNWGSPTLMEYLRSLDGFRYEDDHTDFESLKELSGSAARVLSAAVNKPDPAFFNEDVANHFAERARIIREVYTQLPDTLPERVYDLAQEITADCETAYDKILAIENYFKEDYVYTLTPPAFPEDRDFTDWFLFECNEGYCTYYATAAAVLARCVGLPSRYVEGVVVKDRLRSHDEVEVTNQNVHAWTEVYLEGYGWIPIEPTPGFGVGRSQEWSRRSSVTGGAPEIPVIPPEEIPVEPEILPEEEGLSAAELAALEALRREQMGRILRITAMIAAGVTLMLLIAIPLVLRRARAKHYNRAADDEKIRILMREVVRCVAVAGVRIRADETLLEYVRRAGLDFDYSDMKLSEAAELFMKVRYAEKPVTRAEVLTLYRYTRELRRETLKRQNIIKRALFGIRQFVQ